jgi:hypothetical protein
LLISAVIETDGTASELTFLGANQPPVQLKISLTRGLRQCHFRPALVNGIYQRVRRVFTFAD